MEGKWGVVRNNWYTLKIDKISKGRLKENLKVYTDKLLETWEELPPIFLSSSEKKEGRDEILDYIESINNSLNN